jgi:transposase
LGYPRGKVSLEKRKEYLSAVNEAVSEGFSKEFACKHLEISIRTIQRWEKSISEDQRRGPKTKPKNALSEKEKQNVLKLINSKEFCDLPPGQIVPKLADQGMFVASESTMYRILKEYKMDKHREKSAPAKNKKPDPAIATGPNQVWSWDITYLKSTIKGIYFYLYLPMDIFSRKIVEWEVHEVQSDVLAAQMILNACVKNNIQRDQIRLHQDNGAPMKGATMLSTMQALGVTLSYSRPSVSDDNPFSEALFRTLKYCPEYPEHGFLSLENARKWVEKFVHWYNIIHLHRGIQWVTPEKRHVGLDCEILANRSKVYQKAKESNGLRWSKNIRDWRYIDAVYLNDPGNKKPKSSKKKIKSSFIKSTSSLSESFICQNCQSSLNSNNLFCA